MKPLEEVKEWVSKRNSFYLFLPDGPYGSPFDNQYLVKTVNLTDRGLEIKFSDGLSLFYTGEPDVVDEGCNLMISNYNLCKFRVHNQLLKSFDYGEVVLNGF
ncbi:hypothetical protein ACR6A7_00685 [Pantoea sp. RRHST58]|uniref:hypothetical protein n=1 Tax=Pantoea sp. RRHST58 TaxID=3425183 RepID=UPI003D9FFCC0